MVVDELYQHGIDDSRISADCRHHVIRLNMLNKSGITCIFQLPGDPKLGFITLTGVSGLKDLSSFSITYIALIIFLAAVGNSLSSNFVNKLCISLDIVNFYHN
jgi:hypothetical protein